jgi:hypothetical protein
MLDVMYEAPGTSGGVCLIDADVVNKVKQAKIKPAKSKASSK